MQGKGSLHPCCDSRTGSNEDAGFCSPVCSNKGTQTHLDSEGFENLLRVREELNISQETAHGLGKCPQSDRRLSTAGAPAPAALLQGTQ